MATKCGVCGEEKKRSFGGCVGANQTLLLFWSGAKIAMEGLMKLILKRLIYHSS